MPYFVIVFDRRKRRLEQLEKFQDEAVDLAYASLKWHQERLAPELDYWDVVLFESPSYEVLRRTHSMYFPRSSGKVRPTPATR